MRRIVITSEALNCYGTWILTAGMIIEQYIKNPVLLWMHRRGGIIGYLKDIRVEKDGTITAEPVFDEASEDSVRSKKQYEAGSLRMASVGIEILELSEDPALLKVGQTSPTITKCKLQEVSLVDIGGNDDAIRLTRDGVDITLGEGGSNPLPTINTTPKSSLSMDLKKLALMLGLPETATEADIQAKIMELMSQTAELTQLRAERDSLNLSAITDAVNAAISDHRLGADKKDQFIELGKKVGVETLKQTLSAMNPAAKISSIINPGGGVPSGKYTKLSEVPASEVMKLRQESPSEYKALYKAEYGIDCNL